MIEGSTGLVQGPRSRLVHMLQARFGRPGATDPGAWDAALVRRVIGGLGKVFGPGRYIDMDVRGWDNVPDAPALFVSNHSGGTIIPDVWGFGVAWHNHFAFARPLHILGHEMVFSIPALGEASARVGGIRATPESAHRVLTQWKRDVLVMPGGDRDVWRPYKDRFKVQFAGRKGYARLALKSRVPVVPVANAGAHETLRVLTDGTKVARALGLQRLVRAEVFPVHLSFPWGLAIGPWPHIPLPTRFRYRFGPPVIPAMGYPSDGAPPDEDMVDAYDEQVRAAVQSLLDGLASE